MDKVNLAIALLGAIAIQSPTSVGLWEIRRIFSPFGVCDGLGIISEFSFRLMLSFTHVVWAFFFLPFFLSTLDALLRSSHQNAQPSPSIHLIASPMIYFLASY